MSALTPAEATLAQDAYATLFCTDTCAVRRPGAPVVALDGFEPVTTLALVATVACRMAQLSASTFARADAVPATGAYRAWFPVGTDVRRGDVLTDIVLAGGAWPGPASLRVDNIVVRRSAVLAELSAARV